MSLICVHCGKIIVVSDHPDHLAVCSSCPIGEIPEAELKQVEKSSEEFAKLSKEVSRNDL